MKKKNLLLVITTILILTAQGYPYSPAMRKAMAKGPWEIVVTMGDNSQNIRFPINVADTSKPSELKKNIPIMGTPLKIKLKNYLPDLTWVTTVIDSPDGGIIVDLSITGQDLNQSIMLDSNDKAKRSITSSVGSIILKKLKASDQYEKNVARLAEADCVGLLTAYPNDPNKLIEYAVKKKDKIKLPDSEYQIEILEYVPHYSIDTETKKVTNFSDSPENPAVKVQMTKGDEEYQQWLWTKFPTSPHAKEKLPVTMEFTDFDLAKTEAKYIITASPGKKPWIFYKQEDEKHAEQLPLNKAYQFKDGRYTFEIKKVYDNAIVKTEWKNNSDQLTNPAVIIEVAKGNDKTELVVELNKQTPYHSKHGNMVFMLTSQKQPENTEKEKQNTKP